jgi:cell division protein FtsL
MKYLTALNVVLLAGLVGLAVVLYVREHDTRQAEREIRRLQAEIAREEETLRILEVEWATLSNPLRIERLVRRHLALGPVAPTRMAPLGMVLDTLPVRRHVPHAAQGDPLAALISRLESQDDAGRVR